MKPKSKDVTKKLLLRQKRAPLFKNLIYSCLPMISARVRSSSRLCHKLYKFHLRPKVDIPSIYHLLFPLRRRLSPDDTKRAKPDKLITVESQRPLYKIYMKKKKERADRIFN